MTNFPLTSIRWIFYVLIFSNFIITARSTASAYQAPLRSHYGPKLSWHLWVDWQRTGCLLFYLFMSTYIQDRELSDVAKKIPSELSRTRGKFKLCKSKELQFWILMTRCCLKSWFPRYENRQMLYHRTFEHWQYNTTWSGFYPLGEGGSGWSSPPQKKAFQTFPGEHAPRPPQRPSNFFSRRCVTPKIFQDRLPPQKKTNKKWFIDAYACYEVFSKKACPLPDVDQATS